MEFSKVLTRQTKSDDRQRRADAFWSLSPKLSVVILLLIVFVGSHPGSDRSI